MSALQTRTIPVKQTRSMLPAPRHTPLPSRRVSALREGQRIRKRGLYLGTAPDGQSVYLSYKHLRTHLHIIGPTGQGKSRLVLFILQLLCHTNRPIVLVDPKGDLYKQARDWCIANGFGKRLVLFDLSGDVIPGYNPLRQNGLRTDLQAQWVRQSVMSAWNASSSFETTPLLVRMLYLCLYVARAMEVSLLDALDVLRPFPTLRQRALQRITDPFVHNALLAYDSLSDRLKLEQSSSTVSRLEMFLCDQTVRQVICSPVSIDTEQVLAERKIWLINAAKNQPILADQIKLLLRFITNDILAHIYKGHGEGRFNEYNPFYYIADEFQNAATSEMATALDEMRGCGLSCILAHQHLSQLADEDKAGYLLQSCMANARTKIIFGGLDYSDLEVFANNLLLQHFNPRAVKHIQKNPIFAPIKTMIEVPTYSTSKALSHSVTENYSEADSVSHSVEHSVSHGRSIADSISETEGESEAYTQGRNSSLTESQNWGHTETQGGARTRSAAHTEGRAVGHGRSRGWSSSDGTTDAYGTSSASGWSQSDARSTGSSAGEGQTMLPPEERVFFQEDPEVVGLSVHTGTSEGHSSSSGTSGMTGSSASHAVSRMRGENASESESMSHSSADMVGFSESENWSSGWNEGHGVARTDGESEAWTQGTNRSTTRGKTVTNSESVTDGYSDTAGHTSTRGIGFTEGETVTHGRSWTLSPFYEYRREEIETPVFLTPEEQKLLVMQRLSRIPKQHFLVKAPESSDHIIRAPHVPDPIITKRRLAAGLQSVYSALPCYTTIDQRIHGGTGGVPRVTGDHVNSIGHSGNDNDHGHHGAGDVIHIEAQVVRAPQSDTALPSPTDDAEQEAALWQRVRSLSRGANALPAPAADDDEPVFWRPATERKARQEKS